MLALITIKNPGISRPNRRERIETFGPGWLHSSNHVSPGLTAGSELKRRHKIPYQCRVQSISRPNRRERIETLVIANVTINIPRISRPNRRERIETRDYCTGIGRRTVSPGLTAGSGLKPSVPASLAGPMPVSPGLTAGSGLKRFS